MNDLDQKRQNEPSLFNEVSLNELVSIFWKGKLLITITTSILALSSIIYSLSLPNYYSSKSILIVRDSQNSGSLSQYSGFASLAIINLPSSTDNNSVYEVMEMIQSREFVKHLIQFKDVLPSIMAAERYDPATKTLFDEDLYNSENKTWTREPSVNKAPYPHMKHIMSIILICLLFLLTHRQV